MRSIGPNLCQNCLQKDKNLIGIQSVKHTSDRDHAGRYVGLDLGLIFLLKKRTVLTNSPRYTVIVQKFEHYEIFNTYYYCRNNF